MSSNGISARFENLSRKQVYDEKINGEILNGYWHREEKVSFIQDWAHNKAEELKIPYQDFLKLIAYDVGQSLKKVYNFEAGFTYQADGFAEFIRGDAERNPEIKELFRRKLEGKTILDLGCGPFESYELQALTFIKFLVKECGIERYIGVDPNGELPIDWDQLELSVNRGFTLDELSPEKRETFYTHLNRDYRPKMELIVTDALTYLADQPDESAIITANGLLCELMSNQINEAVACLKGRDCRSVAPYIYEIMLAEQIYRVTPKDGIFFGNNICHQYPSLLEYVGFKTESTRNLLGTEIFLKKSEVGDKE